MPDVLDQWAHARVQTFPVSNGFTVELQPLDIRECLRYGRVPNPLIGVAQKIEKEGIDPTELDEKESNDWFDFRCWCIADGVVAVTDKDGNREEGKLEPEFVATKMPPEDRELLWNYRIHLYNTEAAEQLVTMLDAVRFRGDEAVPDNRAGRRTKKKAS